MKIRCIETNEIFDNLIIAAVRKHIKYFQLIQACCQGKLEAAGGFHWEYIK